jgi:hypothetical protein
VSWSVEYTDEFEAWWNLLSEAEQEEISAKVELLEERGPTLARPHADRVESSRHSNMKEAKSATANCGSFLPSILAGQRCS